MLAFAMTDFDAVPALTDLDVPEPAEARSESGSAQRQLRPADWFSGPAWTSRQPWDRTRTCR